MRKFGMVRALLVIACVSLACGSADAKKRGEAGTKTREAYCDEQYGVCKRKGEDECIMSYQHGTAEEIRNCNKGVEAACRSYFIGKASACNLAARNRPVESVYGPAIRDIRAKASKSQRAPDIAPTKRQ